MPERAEAAKSTATSFEAIGRPGASAPARSAPRRATRPSDPGRRRARTGGEGIRRNVDGIRRGHRRHHGPDSTPPVSQQDGSRGGGRRFVAYRAPPSPSERTTRGCVGDPRKLPAKPGAPAGNGDARLDPVRGASKPSATRAIQDPAPAAAPGDAAPGAGRRRECRSASSHPRRRRGDQHADRLVLRPLPQRRANPEGLGQASTCVPMATTTTQELDPAARSLLSSALGGVRARDARHLHRRRDLGRRWQSGVSRSG